MPGTTRQNSSPHAVTHVAARPRPTRRHRRGRLLFASKASDAGAASPSPDWRDSTVTAMTSGAGRPASIAPRSRAVAGGAHHHLASQRVHVEHPRRPSARCSRRHARPCWGCRGAWRPRTRAVSGRCAAARPDPPPRASSRPTFSMPDVRCEQRRRACRPRRASDDVERHDERVLGPRDHGRPPVDGVVRGRARGDAARMSPGDARFFSFR